MPGGFSRARSRAIFRSNSPRKSSWRSTSKPRKPSASPFRSRCCSAPTRSSNKRREFITLLGGAATWPAAARAEQASTPVVGVLSSSSLAGDALYVAGFRQGLSEMGFVEGRNVAIEYRWAEGQLDRMPAFAADLVRRQVAVIFANSPPAVRAVKAETAAIPVVFSMGEDPIKEGI